MADAATAFAGQTALVAAYLDKAELADGLQQAMDSRGDDRAGQGRDHGKRGYTPEEAFDILRLQSQAENRKLRDIAAELVTGQRRRPDQ